MFSLFWSNRFLVSVYYREWWKHVRLHLCWECYSCPYMCWRSFRFSNGLCGRKGTPKLWIFLGVEFLFFSLSPSPVLVRCMKNEIFPCNPSVGIFHHQSWAYEVLGICISYIGKLGISKVKQASNFLTLTFTSWSFFFIKNSYLQLASTLMQLWKWPEIGMKVRSRPDLASTFFTTSKLSTIF